MFSIFELPEWFTFNIAIVAVFITYHATSVLYNLFFHPLRDYRGPRVLAASRIPITCAVLLGKGPQWVQKLHEEYGSVVRVAPNELSYIDSRAWREIYGSTPARPQGMARGSDLYKFLEDENNSPSLITCSDTEHQRLRNAYAPVFTKRALVDQESLFATYSDLLISKLNDMKGKPINITEMFRFTLFDTVAHIVYGESLGVLEKGANKAWVQSQVLTLQAAVVLSALSDFPWIKFLLVMILPGATKKLRQAFFKFSNDRVDRRLSVKTYEPDLVGITFQSNRKKALSERDVRANAPIIMGAANETLVALLTALTAYLLDQPETLRRLTDEIRTTFQSNSDIKMASIFRLPFLDACIKEGLRIHSPAPSALPRVVPQSGEKIADQWVPGGTRVYVSSFSAMRSSINFHDPTKFHPERWLAESPKKFSTDNKAAYQPFSFGHRSCLAQEMAQYEARLIYCKLLLNFDIQLASDGIPWFSSNRAWTVWENRPLFLHLTPVKSPEITPAETLF